MQKTQETWVQSLGRKDPLEKEMATHSSIHAWKIPGTEEPGRLLSIGSQRVRHNWNDFAHTAAAAKPRQSWLTLCDSVDGSPPGSHPWDSPGKNTGVGCHFLLQRMKVKSESKVAQLCPTFHDPMDCSLPGSSVHGISQARVLKYVAIAFS